ncbi:hypothetical protein [Caldimonas brevitalea]|uniref:Uncharacterized protein n=1 Tax=Caldimonas brevitalea TaxID=413882 RepID=A0A0G3BU19_9BURK|nr:hypothetical protein [Caldimonas brevitalea]AKJ31523.1 hypothetical protein AAW51_4832 [Caldimonas brevitalea]
MSDRMSRNEWIERCAARMLAQQVAMQSHEALDLALQVWSEVQGGVDPEQAADRQLAPRAAEAFAPA